MPISGLMLREFNGRKGRLAIPGLGAVLGEFDSWTLKRPEEAPQEATGWSFRGALSYVNEALLKLDLPIVIELDVQKKTYVVEYDRANWRLEGKQLLVSEVHIRGK